MSRLDNVVFPFEDVGESLNLLPLAARRALDVAGFRLSLEGYQSLSPAERTELCVAGADELVDVTRVEQIVRKSTSPATRIKPVADPDPLIVPDQLNAALGQRRAVDTAGWSRLRALERYALVHVMRRSIAHDDPSRLEAAAEHILPKRRSEAPPRSLQQPSAAVSARRVEVDAGEPHISNLPHDFDLHADAMDRATAPPPLGYPRPPSQPPPSLPPVLQSRPPSNRPPPADRRSEPPVSTHLSQAGDVRMVNVGSKDTTLRRATAYGMVKMRPETALRLARNEAPKGEVLATARVAGILAAKRTSELIPLCHSVAVTSIEVLIDVDSPAGHVNVTAVVEAADRTGVEMEALTAVSVACLTIYDMLKGIDREMTINEIKLLAKQGGKTGSYVRTQG